AACSGDPDAGAGNAPPPPTTAAASPSPTPTPTPSPTPTPTPTPDTEPGLEVEVLADDLELPWDVAELAGGELLVTEKESGRLLLLDGSEQRVLSDGPSGLWSSNETGFMSLAVDPEDDNRFLTCHGHSDDGETDVRVVEWTLDEDRTEATEGDALINGIGSTTGRHGGCRLEISAEGELFVGTGDAAVGENPQDRTSLNGKVLRADPATGEPLADNPFIDADDPDERLVYTYGHRNVQGIAFRDDQVLTAEHGPDVDDEVNLLQAGGNYGWDPVPGYDESVPMTDQDLPGEQVEAVWSSGDPTLAISGMSAVEGPQWGSYAGGLAVAALKASELVFMTLDEDGTVTDTRTPDVLTGYGRLRSVTQAADGSLLVTTSNGSDDQLLRVTPTG
uniref:PQQ-dependent sugar dehydrogenase n=1 Tax=Desertihabitans aurantiacus TaxID=2282477 RepID=UPI000DF868F4